MVNTSLARAELSKVRCTIRISRGSLEPSSGDACTRGLRFAKIARMKRFEVPVNRAVLQPMSPDLPRRCDLRLRYGATMNVRRKNHNARWPMKLVNRWDA